MKRNNRLFIGLLMIVCVVAIFGIVTKGPKMKKAVCGKDENRCINDRSCQCYCSRKCGPRDKKSDDDPIYVSHDKYGHYCYCKQWDYDHRNECPAEK